MTSGQFTKLTEAVQEPLRRFLTALCCGNPHMADDIAQETLIKAYLACSSFNNPGKFKAWVLRIAYTTFLNYKRSERPTEGYDEAMGLASADKPDDRFKYQALYSALERIPSHERTSILLFYMEGYSVKEISSITGSSEDAVRQHLTRGRSHLRSLLEQ